MSYMMVPLNQIQPSQLNPRKSLFGSLDGLTGSIKKLGVLEPIHVIKNGKGYRIVFGERRYHAAKAAGLKEIPAIVANKNLTPEEEFEAMLVENLQREDLTPIEEAEAFNAALDIFECTQADLAKRLGISQPQVSNTLRLLNLPEEMQQDVSEGKLSASNARMLITQNEETIKELGPQLRGKTVKAAKEIIDQRTGKTTEAIISTPQTDNKIINILEDLNFQWRQGDIDKVVSLYSQECSIRKIADEVGRTAGTDGKIEVIMLLLHMHMQGVVKINFGLFSKTAR